MSMPLNESLEIEDESEDVRSRDQTTCGVCGDEPNYAKHLSHIFHFIKFSPNVKCSLFTVSDITLTATVEYQGLYS